MRSIGKVLSETDALRLSSFLKRKGILHTCEAAMEEPSQHVAYEFWVHSEDQLEEAKKSFETFLQNPTDSSFDIPITEQAVEEREVDAEEPVAVEDSRPGRRRAFFTKLIIALCAAVFFLNETQEGPLLQESTPEAALLFTPIQTSCLYDLPPFFEKLAELMQKHKGALNGKAQPLDTEIQADLEALPHTAYWRGFYDWFALKIKGQDSSEAEGPLFIKIRQGEIWRLISPVILHGGILHILFNMIWVWILSRPIEQRIGFFRTLLLSLIVGIGSNTAQYLMGGPFFLGYSGVVMGLAAFIWIRQKKAPWEGYPIQNSTLVFLGLFVLAMLALQIALLILHLFSSVEFPLNIANTAHISGALLGAFLGKFKFFSWKVSS